MKKHLVTGGTGFIGRELVHQLLDLGDEVVVLDNFSRNYVVMNHPSLTIKKCDLTDPTQTALNVESCDTVWHLAALNGTKNFYETPKKVLDVGVRGLINLIDALAYKEIKKFVLASSSEVYQTPTTTPTLETEQIKIPDILNPRYSYAISKIFSESYISSTYRDKFVIFRPHNFYGPNAGFDHVIPAIIQKMQFALNNSDSEIVIRGTGNETRSFCFVNDGVKGIIIVGTIAPVNEIYHIGNFGEIKIKELVDLIAKIMNAEKIRIRYDNAAATGGTNRRHPNITKLSQYGYQQSVSLHDGLLQTIKSYIEVL